VNIKWSLQRLKFLFDHVGDFVDSDWREIRERATHFSPQTGLDQIEDLIEPAPQVRQPLHVLDRLTPFFDAGMMLSSDDQGRWIVTDVFWRGSVFHLDPDEQTRADHLVREITPLQVQKAPAPKILKSLNMEFLAPSLESEGYLLRPAPRLSFVLFSNLASPWAHDHVAHAHRLINKAFVY
jgi:hypothetical protein